jgi:opacity protein-like surface antigen
MKVLVAVFCALMCLAQGASAGSYHASQDKKFDLFLTTGYGFGVGGYQDSSTDFSATYSPNITDREDHYRNFGWGIKIEGGADYELMDHVYGQAALNFSFSAVPGTENVQDLTGVSTRSVKYSWSIFGIKAGIKPTFRIFDLLDAYTTFGIGLYFANSGAEISQSIIGAGESTEKAKDHNTPALTFIGAIGAEYPINESIILYGEINCEQMSFTTTKIEYVEATGVFSNRVVNFQEDATDRSSPPKIPGTNIALRVGVRFPIF